MEDEIKAGIEKFKAECERQCPGIALVIPTRPTGANFLISFTSSGMRTYGTIHEDDFADWGEASGTPEGLIARATEYIQKIPQAR